MLSVTSTKQETPQCKDYVANNASLCGKYNTSEKEKWCKHKPEAIIENGLAGLQYRMRQCNRT